MDGKGQARKNREKSDQQKDALNKKKTKPVDFIEPMSIREKSMKKKLFKIEKIGFI